MKLSTKSRYALRCVLDIAIHGKTGPLSIAEIGARQDISDRYLELIFAKLKKAGFIKSVRGSKGGYALSKPIEEIYVYDIVSTMESNASIIKIQDEKDPIRQLLFQEVWNPIDKNLEQYLSHIVLTDLL